MPTLADVIGGQVQTAIEGAIGNTYPEQLQLFETAAQAGGQKVVDGFSGGEGGIVGLLGDIPLIGGVIGDVLDPLDSLIGKLGPAASGMLLSYALGLVSAPAFQEFLSPAIQGIHEQSQNFLIDPPTAAQAVAAGIIDLGEGRSIAAKQGFDDHQFDTMVTAATSRLPAAQLLAALNRGLVSEDFAREALQRQGYDSDTVPVLLDLRRQLLSPADLALALLRGNMTEDEAQAYAARLGLDDDDLELLEDNTGEPPGLEQLLQWYRRDILGEAELARGVRQSRVRDEWLPYILKGRVVPPSTSDATRAYVQGYISLDDAKKIAYENGLDPSEYEWVAESFGDPPSRTELTALYNRGEITQDTVEQGLRESRLKDKYIGDVLKLTQRLIPYRTVNTIVTHGIESPAWGIAQLMKWGYTHDEAAAMVGTATSGRSAVHKNLAQGMILDMYEARAISSGEAIEDLELLGWDSDQARFILAVQDAKASLGEQRKAITAVRKAYLAHRLTDSQAREDLADLGVLSNEQDTLLADWKIEVAGQVQELTPLNVADAAKYGALSWDAAVKKLVQLGYTANDAGIYLAADEVPVPKGVTLSEPAP